MKRKTLRVIRFVSVLCMGLALSPALAHLLELPNKIHLSAEDYLTVQQIYKGWSYLGIVEFLTLVSISILAFMIRREPKIFFMVVQSLFTFIAALIIFFVFTYPVNTATDNWTKLPDNWERLRNRWEYSHATRAGLILFSFIVLLLSNRSDGANLVSEHVENYELNKETN